MSQEESTGRFFKAEEQRGTGGLLEACFLLRDAARSLEVGLAGGKAARQTPLDRAEAGFAWVVREVRLPPPGRQPISAEPAPPAPVLRRGQGSPLERALVFLALLE